MARFTLVVRPDGSALLTTPERLPADARQMVLAQLNAWLADGPRAVAIVPECEVVQVRELSIELALPEPIEEVPA